MSEIPVERLCFENFCRQYHTLDHCAFSGDCTKRNCNFCCVFLQPRSSFGWSLHRRFCRRPSQLGDPSCGRDLVDHARCEIIRKCEVAQRPEAPQRCGSINCDGNIHRNECCAGLLRLARKYLVLIVLRNDRASKAPHLSLVRAEPDQVLMG